MTALIAGFALMFCRLRPMALAVLACCWALYSFHARLEGQLPPVLANQLMTITGHVSSVPSAIGDSVRFRFQADQTFREQGIPANLLITWYRDSPDISVGQRWRLELRLKPPWGRVNFLGPDKERWLFAQGIGGLASVRGGQLLVSTSRGRFAVNRLREKVMRRISQTVSDQRQRGVIQALATADRSGLTSTDTAVLRTTGTSHLLAISGLHVGLAAGGGMWLVRVMLLLIPLSIVGHLTIIITAVTGIISALVYAALAGFGIPTMRSALMLMTVMIAVLLSRSIHPVRAWVISLAVILVINPFAPLGAGLWFSFLAIFALILVFRPRTGPERWWITMLMAQAGVVLMLMPIGATWFGTFSPSAFFANLFAIPWVSILLVPLVLAGLATSPISGFITNMLWSLAGTATSILFFVLEAISDFQGPMMTLPSPGILQTALALFGAVLCLLPRGLPVRWFGLFLMIPLVLPQAHRSRGGTLIMDVLDVGQGTAVLISSGGDSLLYDSGPGDGREQSLVNSVITPALVGLGQETPRQVIISHGDLDHSGGLQSLQRVFPDAGYRGNYNADKGRLDGCSRPDNWSWPGVGFEILHPSAWLPYQGNDSSCVVSVRAAGGRLLLAGDISETIERRLVADEIPSHRLLLVPHHGSSTSSSEMFIRHLQPEIAIATAGLGNRFGFPREEIRSRYEAAGVQFWSTAECGALRVILQADGSIQAFSARRQRNRVWRWPAAENCP